MIGGRVLDVSALVAFAEQRSVYMSAAVWTATEEDIVLLVPATASSAAWTAVGTTASEVLDVLLGLPVTVVDPLHADRARVVGDLAQRSGLGDDLAAAHSAWCALDRSWPLMTAEPRRYEGLGDDLVIDDLP